MENSYCSFRISFSGTPKVPSIKYQVEKDSVDDLVQRISRSTLQTKSQVNAITVKFKGNACTLTGFKQKKSHWEMTSDQIAALKEPLKKPVPEAQEKKTSFLSKFSKKSSSKKKKSIKKETSPLSSSSSLNLVSSINRLPNELIEYIFSFCKKKDLVNFGFTCKRFNSTAYPFLVRHFFNKTLFRAFKDQNKKIPDSIYQNNVISLELDYENNSIKEFQGELSNFKNLEYLHVYHASEQQMNLILEQSKNFALQEVEFKASYLSENQLEKFAKNNPQLKKITLRGCVGENDSAGNTLKGLKAVTTHCEKLESIAVIFDPTKINDSDLFSLANYCSKLKEFSMDYSPSSLKQKITNIGIESIIENSPLLEIIKINNNETITDEFVEKLGKSCTHLEKISLFNNLKGVYVSITDAKMENLLKNNPQVTELKFSGTEVSDKTLEIIGHYCPKIEIVYVNATSVTLKELYFFGAKNCPNLKMIEISMLLNSEYSDLQKLCSQYEKLLPIGYQKLNGAPSVYITDHRNH